MLNLHCSVSNADQSVLVEAWKATVDLVNAVHVTCPPSLPLQPAAEDIGKKVDVAALFPLLDNFDKYYQTELMFGRLTHSGGSAAIHVSVII